MDYKDTVMSERETAALLRGMPYHPTSEAGWMNFARRSIKAQAEISFHLGVGEDRELGIRKVVEHIEDKFDGAYDGLTEYLRRTYQLGKPS